MALAAPRSTLELLLDSLKQRDEKPADIPPVLPQRPTAKGRLPSAVRMRKSVVGTAAATVAPRTEFSSVLRSDPFDISNASYKFFSTASQKSAAAGHIPEPDFVSHRNHREKGDMKESGNGAASQVYPASKQKCHFTDVPYAAEQNWVVAEATLASAQNGEATERDGGLRYEVVENQELVEINKIVDTLRDEVKTEQGDKNLVTVTNSAEGGKGSLVAAFRASNEEVLVANTDDKDTREVHAIEEIYEAAAGWQRQADNSDSDHDHLAEEASSEEDSQLYFQQSAAKPEHVIISGRKRKRHEGVSGLRKNSRVWFLNSDKKWMLGVIQSTVDNESVVSTADSKNFRIVSKKLLPANPAILEGVDDLVQLSYLNGPAILHNLHARYAQNKIYTRAGPVLIAINPFKKVQHCTNDCFEVYSRKSKDCLVPHVHMTAGNAFEAMMRDGVNQSIIISGESGAGKTETAKLAMEYLTVLGGVNGVGNEILQTNQILEAFGNAKTLRNNNSSRFGKLTDIYFDDFGKTRGAKIQIDLLEKSRVVHRAIGERSYHIFYQLCEGADPSLRERLSLRAAKEYQYLNHSGCIVIDGIDDAAQFHSVLNAMDVLQINKKDQETVFAMLAAVLWLGNITFSVFDDDNNVSTDDNEAVQCASKLLKCSKEQLIEALCTRKTNNAHVKIVQKLTYVQAVDSRDALAKSIYESLFEWLVDRINKSLEVEKGRTVRSISILDISGFESFKNNSFEQLFINYANERLQQYVNCQLFKLQQEEYLSEGIDCPKVEFADNQECLDLFEKLPLGLISLLDEECASPTGTDYSFANKLKEHLVGNAFFKGERSLGFGICHYTGEVMYDATGFLDKNRDSLHSELLQLLVLCMGHLSDLSAVSSGQGLQGPLQRSPSELQKRSVATKCKGQLLQMIQWLDSTVPHLIQCIKPNKFQLADSYDQDLVLQQLYCCGLLEILRTSRSGYPTQLPHQHFASRYGFLLRQDVVAHQDVLGICVAILQQFRIPPDMYQVGFTKLFFRAGQVAKLEHTRNQTLHGIISLQKLYRGYKIRCHFKKQRRATILLQSLVRGWLARKSYGTFQWQFEEQFEEKPETTGLGDQKATSTKEPILEKHAASTSVAELESSDVNKLTEVCKVEVQPDTTTRVQSRLLEELQRGVLAAEASLREKEDENALLHQRLQEYEKRWSDYESKMRSMEEMWQKQMTSLQLSLSAARKSMASEEPTSQAVKQNDCSNLQHGLTRQHVSQHVLPQDHDIKTSVATKTSDLNSTLHKSPSHLLDLSVTRGELDPSRSVVGHLVKELEHRTQVFNDDVDFLVEVKSGQTEANFKPDDELRKLKKRFDTWKKDFKVRLRETKAILRKLGKTESAEKTKKWWGKKAN